MGDDELASWTVVEGMHDWAGLLLGNGASLAIWSGFGYRSLYATAVGGGTEHPLSDNDQRVFRALGTTNFEGVLADVRVTAIVNEALGLDVSIPLDRYDSIRDALVAAVHAVHVPWIDVPEATLHTIREALVSFDFVFTTNYDLLLYWAAMAEDGSGVADYFWTRMENSLIFEPRNVDIWHKATKILFLHGGLQLYHLPDGRTIKCVAPAGRSLLDVFGESPLDTLDAIPLFVSEGVTEDKMAAIRRSEYLTFALTTFADFDAPLVVFGHSLSAQDQHLVDIMRRLKAPIAVAVREPVAENIFARKAEVQGRLQSKSVLFFDATTHPLGAGDLAIPVDA